jgi:hypothetical protein
VDYRYPLGDHLIAQALAFEEFANGAAQCHARLSDGSVHSGLLVSNATAITAMRDHSDLPFAVTAIQSLFQTEEDRSTPHRTHWKFFDEWTA